MECSYGGVNKQLEMKLEEKFTENPNSQKYCISLSDSFQSAAIYAGFFG